MAVQPPDIEIDGRAGPMRRADRAAQTVAVALLGASRSVRLRIAKAGKDLQQLGIVRDHLDLGPRGGGLLDRRSQRGRVDQHHVSGHRAAAAQRGRIHRVMGERVTYTVTAGAVPDADGVLYAELPSGRYARAALLYLFSEAWVTERATVDLGMCTHQYLAALGVSKGGVTYREAVRQLNLVAAVRTPMGRRRGALADRSAVDLGVLAVRGALDAVPSVREDVAQVVVGNVIQAGSGQNVARQVSLGAGLAHDVPATTVNEVCGSGLKAVVLGAQLIQLGRAEVVVAAGTESMTRAPLVSAYDDGTRSYGEPRPSLMTDALEDAFTGTPMGLTAEALAPDGLIEAVSVREARAFACCVAEWLNRNPVRSPPGRCHGCGEAEHGHDPLLPFGTEPTGHAWLHSRCWPAWHSRRKAEAIAALSIFEIHETRTSP